MSLSVGIVGLPNVGKSTLFNALLKKQQALAANYPFATIEPNIGVVEVPDERLMTLARIIAGARVRGAASPKAEGARVGGPESEPSVISPDSITKEQLDHTKLPPLVPAVVSFTDIAGLVAGASKGEGLGNKFLAHIREVDLICHVLRAFEDGDVVLTGSMNPCEDLQVIRAELMFKDLETVEKKVHELEKLSRSGDKDAQRLMVVAQHLLAGFNQGRTARMLLNTEELQLIHDWCLLSAKPEIFVVNVSEEKMQDSTPGGRQAGFMIQEFAQKLGVDEKDVVVVSAKVEAELSLLDPLDQMLFLDEMGLVESGIGRMAKVAYGKLGLISFLTAGEKEVRAWTIRKGTMAAQAAGVIHTDFEKKFIKAQIAAFDDFVTLGGWKGAAEKGKMRLEGRDYVMVDGDVVEFRIGS